MKDKEMIEEMAIEDIVKVYPEISRPTAFGIIKILETEGYRKLPKNSVVLSREEYEILQRLYEEIFICQQIPPYKAVENAKILFTNQKELIEKAYKVGSKETAEKIYYMLKRYFGNSSVVTIFDIHDKIEKLVGVEIKG